MQGFVQQMIKKKLKGITSTELLHYAKQYDVVITSEQAVQIASFLHANELNPLLESDRMKMFKKLAQITDLNTAKQAQRLFNQLIKQYGVEGWFS
ncbi:hypothetical protein Pryu01_00559 [Paraliobacillus ryukyuensis]|uniref:Uncharacterized protein DUF2624 n=1 Tax=Paraliobacillus ryukyuensis TaxID=200904 RepID=A0A366EIX5_9BACI|nr:DUF2624 domain-containing protein [Paraliobacillus ryukyuensis]RBP01375.1 uncharacterized protein DUF2624 [Paraliobacillus ryukyuensis]